MKAWIVWVLALVAACASPSAPVKTVSPADIAACTAADGTWRCKLAKPQTFGASSASPIIPSSWTVANWFVNKSTGSDQNPCTSSGSPCATKQEIWVHRLGCFGAPMDCPRFQQTTTLEQDASDTDNNDPLYAHVALEKGASFIVKGGTVAGTAATFTRSTAKNRTAGANALLSGSFSAGVPAVGMLVVNTTRGNSRAWIESSAGGANWNLTQPFAPVTPPTGNAVPAEVDTWVSTDSVTLINPIAINISDISGVQTDTTGSFNNHVYLYNANIFDPLGVFNDNITIGTQIFIDECSLQREAAFIGTTDSYARIQINAQFLGGLNTVGGGAVDAFVDPIFVGGSVQNIAEFASSPAFDGDFIQDVNMTTGAGTQFGFYFMGGNLAMNGSPNAIEKLFYNNSIIYGATAKTFGVHGSGHVVNLTGNTFANTLTFPGNISINASTTACSATAAGVINCGISITPAHLDAAAGAAGFGGTAFAFGGAGISNN